MEHLEHLPGKHDALGSIPASRETQKEGNRERERGRKERKKQMKEKEAL